MKDPARSQGGTRTGSPLSQGNVALRVPAPTRDVALRVPVPHGDVTMRVLMPVWGCHTEGSPAHMGMSH